MISKQPIIVLSIGLAAVAMVFILELNFEENRILEPPRFNDLLLENGSRIVQNENPLTFVDTLVSGELQLQKLHLNLPKNYSFEDFNLFLAKSANIPPERVNIANIKKGESLEWLIISFDIFPVEVPRSDLSLPWAIAVLGNLILQSKTTQSLLYTQILNWCKKHGNEEFDMKPITCVSGRYNGCGNAPERVYSPLYVRSIFFDPRTFELMFLSEYFIIYQTLTLIQCEFRYNNHSWITQGEIHRLKTDEALHRWFGYLKYSLGRVLCPMKEEYVSKDFEICVRLEISHSKWNSTDNALINKYNLQQNFTQCHTSQDIVWNSKKKSGKYEELGDTPLSEDSANNEREISRNLLQGCVGAIRDKPSFLRPWIEHMHNEVNITLLDFYIVSDYSSPEVYAILAPFESQGIARIHDWATNVQPGVDLFMYSQYTAYMDCAYRNMYSADWLLQLDTDEFLKGEIDNALHAWRNMLKQYTGDIKHTFSKLRWYKYDGCCWWKGIRKFTEKSHFKIAFQPMFSVDNGVHTIFYSVNGSEGIGVNVKEEMLIVEHRRCEFSKESQAFKTSPCSDSYMEFMNYDY